MQCLLLKLARQQSKKKEKEGRGGWLGRKGGREGGREERRRGGSCGEAFDLSWCRVHAENRVLCI